MFLVVNNSATDDGLGLLAVAVASGTQITAYFVATATTTYLQLRTTNNASTAYFDNVTCVEVPGNHAYQSTSASRPILRARYNLLTYTEEFNNTSVWTPLNSSVTADQTTAPNGTITADLYVSNATNGQHYVFRNSAAGIPVTSGVNYTFSVYLKKGTGATAPDIMQLAFSSSQFPTGYANFNLSTGAVGTTLSVTASITDAGGGWYRCSISDAATITANSLTGGVVFTNNSDSAGRLPSYADATTSNVFIWGAQLIVTNSLLSNNYQRVAAATDYDTSGFLPYLSFDGTDDSMLTNSIDFSAEDKMTVWAGVRKLSDAAQGVIAELSSTSGTNPDSFLLQSSAAASYGWRSRGSLGVLIDSSAVFASPITNVLTGQGDISGDLSILRVNTFDITTSTADQGTGNFGNYPLYIGRRNNATLPFNGWLTSLIVRGAQSTDAQIEATENWVNGKTGVQFDFVVLTSDGGGYSVPFTALSSSGTSYNIPNTVRSSSGVSYII